MRFSEFVKQTNPLPHSFLPPAAPTGRFREGERLYWQPQPNTYVIFNSYDPSGDDFSWGDVYRVADGSLQIRGATFFTVQLSRTPFE